MLGALGLAKDLFADDTYGVPKTAPVYIRPNVAPVPFKTVSGTVTVRQNGLPVEPQDLSYVFAPEFVANMGTLVRTEEGTYLLKADNIPNDRPYTLRISAFYNDSVKGRDGYKERIGQTYTATLTVQIPYGSDNYDFGVRFMELK